MLSNKQVLPNFLTTLLFAAATAFSVNVMAGDHGGDVEADIGELKDMKKTTTSHDQNADSKTMLDDKQESMLNKLDSSEAAEQAKELQPE